MAKFSYNAKRRGRPISTGTGTLIGVRLTDEKLAELDGWIDQQDDEPTRPEAIRRLVETALAAGKAAHSSEPPASRRAAELAGAVVESRMAADVTIGEREIRKRRSFKGPSTFRRRS